MTPAQLQTLKTAINANPTWAAFPLTFDGFNDLAAALNADAAPNFWVWSTNADVQAIRAAISWANLTPADVPDGTQTWANRSLQCQGKQFNLQMIIPFSGTLNGADSNLRAGLQDALTAIRSGVAGASQGAGWATVQGVLVRKAKYVEKMYADTAGGQDGSTKVLAATMAREGPVTGGEIELARLS
jgi:hypothetical protein